MAHRPLMEIPASSVLSGQPFASPDLPVPQVCRVLLGAS